MSGKYAATIAELRLQRDVIDQTIRNLELLSGGPIAPAAPVTSTYIAHPERAQRALPPATIDPPPSYRRKRKFEVPTHADAAIVAVLQRNGGPMRPKDVIKQAKLSKADALRARQRLVASRQMVVSGATLTMRWALPGTPAKEAP